jgi:hypothetical protein
LPSADGTSGQPLQTNGSGTLSFANLAIANGGTGATSFAANQIIYGSFSQSANLTFNGTTLTANTLNLTNALGTAYGGTGLTSFTTNGVVYASSTSALATGSALTFDGSFLGLNRTAAWAAEQFGISGTSSTQRFIYARSTSAGHYLSLGTNGTLPYLEFGNGSGLAFNDGGTERMRIDSSGNLLVGGTTVRDTSKFTLDTNTNGMSIYVVPNTSAVDFAIFRANAGTLCGAISRVGTTAAVVYTATSDYRLKENVAPMTGALAKIAALKPVTFTWKDGGAAADGFIAHEFAEVCPNGVTGEKDGVDVDGNPKYQAMDSSAAISILVAAIQEQQALITTLTARIEALEAK